MKLRLKNKGIIPYGGTFRYVDPHSGMEFRNYQFDGLVSKIRAHRQANGFPIGLEFEQEVENQVCQNHPDECEAFDPRIPRRRRLALSDVLRGTGVMMQHKLAGSPLESREVAEARARTCLKCQWNTDFDRPCSTGICGELKALVSSVINHQGTQYDRDLKSCNICGCFIQASIWLPLDIQCRGVTEDMKEAFKAVPACWKVCG